MAAPFLTISEFAAEFGSLGAGQTLTAERLLQVASDRIRQLQPLLDVDEDAVPQELFDAAQQVVFEIVRDAINYGGLEKLSSFQNITSRRQEGGTFDEAMKVVNDLLSDRHKRFLGIAVKTAPRGHFVKCDY